MPVLHDALATADPPIVRARDLTDVWAQPDRALARLADDGALLRVAHGLYMVVPLRARGNDTWRPTIEEVALAVAQRRFGRGQAALMHVSAARVHGVWPRRTGAAVVAVPGQRATLDTVAGRVVFVARDVDALDAARHEVATTRGLVTGVELTALDLLDRPNLADTAAGDARQAAEMLLARADRDLLRALARRLRKRAALEVAEQILDSDAPKP